MSTFVGGGHAGPSGSNCRRVEASQTLKSGQFLCEGTISIKECVDVRSAMTDVSFMLDFKGENHLINQQKAAHKLPLMANK